MEGFQLIISGLVTVAVTAFGYLSLKLKIQATGHENRIKILEEHKERCEKDLKLKTDQLQDARTEQELPWPSDHEDFQTTVATVKKAYERSGQILTMRDATLIAKRMWEKKLANTKIGLGKEGAS